MNTENKISNNETTTWPEDELETVDKCPVCGSENRVLMHEGLTDNIFHCAPGYWTLFRCRDCETGYLDPRPTEASIGLAYQSYFTHEGTNTNFASLSITQKIRRMLGNGYRNWRFGTKHRNATSLGVIAALIMVRMRKIIDASMRQLPRVKSGQSILDFGCGNGDFLQQAKMADWDCVGIDFDSNAVEVSRQSGLDVHQGGVETLKSLDRQFDIITLSHVIEHVHDPKALVTACYERLKTGGKLWLETPNLNSQGHEIYGADWRGLEPPRHLVLFTPQSLFDLLKKAGFTKIEHQSETPAIRMVFGASEAIRAGADPWNDAPIFAHKNKKQWRKYEERSKINPDQREFITVVAWK